MTESRARHISLIATALEAIGLFFPIWTALGSGMTGGSNMLMLTIEGSSPPIEWIVFLLIFFGIGAFVVSSAFFKIPFYVFSVAETALMGFYAASAAFHPMVIFLCLAVLAPQMFYYMVRINLKFKA